MAIPEITKPIKMWVQNALPLVFDDSLSYYEVLAKLTNYINQLISDVNELAGSIGKYDNDIAELRTEISDVNSEIDSIETDIQNVESDMTGINERINGVVTSVDSIESNITSISNSVSNLQSDVGSLNNSVNDVIQNITAINSDLKRAMSPLYVEFTIDRAWQRGTINPITGRDANAENNIRNKAPVGFMCGVTNISCDDGYVFTIFAYDMDSNYVGCYKESGEFNKEGAGHAFLQSFDCTQYPDYYFYISLRKNPTAYTEIEESVHTHYTGIQKEGHQWAGKVAYFYGSSLTYRSDSYWRKMANELGLVGINKGIQGQGIGDFGASSTGGVYNAICNITDGKLAANLIVLETGANDVMAGVPLGTIYDTGRTTLAGCLNDCIRYLQANTDAQIIVTPSSASTIMPNAADQAWTWKMMIKDICFINCVHFINCDSNLGYAKVTSEQGSAYIVDIIHPTKLGADINGQNFKAQLVRIPAFPRLTE